MSCVYLATNRINGKRYIGQTVNFDSRKKTHDRDVLKGSQLLFHRAIRKYGFDAFNWEKLYRVSSADVLHGKEKMMLDQWERYYIKKLNTLSPNGYNLTIGGRGTTGLKWSKEARKRVKGRHLGRTYSDATLLKMSLSHKGQRPWNKGKKMSPKYRDNLLKALNMPEVKKKKSDAMKRVWQSTNLRSIVSKAKKGNKDWLGRKHTQESKAKIRNALLGHPVSKNTKDKLRIASLSQWASPKQQAIIPWNRGKKLSVETRIKMSIAKKGIPKPPGFGNKIKKDWKKYHTAKIVQESMKENDDGSASAPQR